MIGYKVAHVLLKMWSIYPYNSPFFCYFSMGGGDLSEYIRMLIGVSIYKAPNVEYQLTKQVLQILELQLNNILS